MTALCGGATSSPKSGAPGIAAFGSASITAAIEAWAAFAGPLGIALDAFMFDVSSSCPDDPPDVPTFDWTDATTIALGVASPYYDQTAHKIGDLLKRIAWLQYCKCDGPTPAPPMTQVQPPAGVGGGAGAGIAACHQGAYSGRPPFNNSNSTAGFADVAPMLVPVSGTPTQLSQGGVVYTAYPVSTSMNYFKWTCHFSSFDNSPYKYSPGVGFYFWGGTQNYLGAFSMEADPAFGANKNQNYARIIPAGTAYMAAVAGYYNADAPGAIVDDTTINLQIFCGGSTDTSISSCCPPDPAVQLALKNIMDIVTDIRNRLAPAATEYVDGVRHVGISGTGSFLLAPKCAAIRVEVHPPYPPLVVVPGTPDYHFDMGFITPYENQSAYRSTRVTFTTQTVPLPAFSDQLGYTLLNGVVVDLVELQAA